MEVNIAKQIGGRKVLKAQIISILVLEFGWMLLSIQGDFANNILFFIDAQMNLDVLFFFVLLLGSAWLLGRKAGVEILIKSGETAITIIKYALVMSGLILFYLLGVYFFHNGFREGWNFILGPFFLIAVAITLAWVWAVKKMEKMKAP